MAQARPSTLPGFGRLHGVGERKLVDLGGRFVEAIAGYCRSHGLSMDHHLAKGHERAPRQRNRSRSAGVQTAFRMFEDGRSVDEVMQATGRARSTVFQYLAEFIESAGPRRIDRWVDAESYRRVCEAADMEDGMRLKPIFDRLGGAVPYETIRLVLAHQKATHAAAG
jgi:hypothetical protein